MTFQIKGPRLISVTVLILLTVGLWRCGGTKPPPPPTPLLTGVSLSSGSVVGGNSVTGTVTLSSAAPSGGAVVSLQSNNGAATVPGSVTVNSGASSATFTVSTSTVASATSVSITASFSGASFSASLTVTTLAPTLTGVSLNAGSVVGGGSVQGTVTLSSAAPSGGATVNLSSNSSAATVPGNVTVSAGATTATFNVTTTTVATTTSVVITASFSGTNQTATLSVTTPAAPVASFFVRSKDSTPVDNRCQLRTDFTLNCVFNGSASSGSPVRWIWTYRIGPNMVTVEKQSDAILDMPSTTIQGNTCGLFQGQTGGSPTSLGMIVELKVRNAAGVESAVVTNNNVRVFPSGQGTCGF